MKSNTNNKFLTLFSAALSALIILSCQKDQIAEVTLKTNEPAYVLANEVSITAEIISNGGLTITKRGVCFSTTENPTPIQGQVLSTSTSTTFTVTATNLLPYRKYYCRAFAESNNLLFYGQQVSFTTLSSVPYVQTSDLKESDATTATFGGNILSDGGYNVMSRGVVWNTSGAPTLENNTGFTTNGTGNGTFESEITGLTPNVTYYIRAYATNQMGTSYGKERTFKNGWTQKANIPQELVFNDQNIGFTIGSTGHAINLSINYTNNYEYNPAQNSWTQGVGFEDNMRQDAVVFSIGTKAYLGLGSFNYGDLQFNDFWEYNSSTRLWTKLSDFPSKSRIRAFTFCIGDKAYVGGGYHQDYESSYTLNDLWEFNPIGNTWVQKANFPGEGSDELIGLSIGNMGYVADIKDGRKSFWQYNPVTNKWARKADFRGDSRRNAVGFVIENKGYLGTGVLWKPDQYYQELPLKDFWEYDPENNSWTRKADYTGGVSNGTFSFTIGDKAFVGGGYDIDHSPKYDFWEYTP